jgi:F-type H+-transporting ATPase subunit delta
MVNIIVTSAVDLSAAQIEKIKKAAAKKYDKSVTIENVVDPTIVAGLQITIGSRQLDGSVKSKLQQLKQSLQ